ncbi:MAG: aminodeoxychorismate synthase component I [Mangrovibacterium sp.]
MNTLSRPVIRQMNEWGAAQKPFVFLFDFDCKQCRIWEDGTETAELLWRSPNAQNFSPHPHPWKPVSWQVEPVSEQRYQRAFDLVQHEVHSGNSFLLNLTMPSQVATNLSLTEIAHRSTSNYLVFLKNKFVCFSPEIFVRIENGRISSYPMKGTIDALLPNAEHLLKTNYKELAEHHTIIDLIRNDLSQVAEQVEVARFCYLDEVKSNQGKLLQMSSEISGRLPENYRSHLGDIFARLLPAGSITGAPKKKTVEIIKTAEQYDRGWYTGIFGRFDGSNVDSCVLIRYLEQNGKHFTFKSGGGITHLSRCHDEYHELIRKVYVPIT